MYNGFEEDAMTYTQPNINTDFSIIPGEDIAVMAQKMQAAGQSQVAKDIARLKAMGEPIYYEIGSKLVREESDGRKFEYQLQEDGTEEILGELP
jgi:predicted DNA-binding transcriptional regulator YafY